MTRNTPQPPATEPVVLGIDFGTSNSAAAWRVGTGPVQHVPLEGEALALPTALFFNAEDHRVHFGRDAVAQYLSGTEGRLMRSLKSLLGSPLLLETTEVLGQATSFQDIIATFLAEIRVRAVRHMGREPTHVVLGRPVHFVDGDPARDALAQRMLQEAAYSAGLGQVAFELEPMAAALDHERRIARDSRVLVADIGGGTSDFTLVRLGPGRMRPGADRRADVLATTGIHIGGTDFDHRLSLAQAMPLLGFRHHGPDGREVPSAVFFDLATWHLIHWRYSAKAQREAQALRTNYTDPALHQRLMRVLSERLGHHIANDVEQAKITLSMASASGQTQTASPVAMDWGYLERGLQSEWPADVLTDCLQAPLAQVVACAQACVAQAGLPAGALDAVYLTGGSSSLTPFRAALQQAFAGVPLVEGDVFGGVAAGLAVG
ncbi:MAG: Hsp70 family protein [Burkholderiaceae bacterium]|nr:Hsp70 family protein [Burkholderiaceae bacterium]